MTVMEEVTPDEKAPLSDASLARLAVAAAAQDLADFARAFVSIRDTRHSSGGELEDGQKLVAKAEYVLERLVVFERVAGASWEDIGSGLSMARQNAHKKFRSAVEEFEHAVAEPEVTNPDTGVTYNQLPEGADDPAWWADRLDAWVRRHQEPTEFEMGDRERPVSGGLARLGPLAELGRLSRQRTALLNRYIAPPAEELLPIAERELELYEQLAAHGYTTAAESAELLRRRIAQLRGPQPGDRVELTYRDGSGCVGTWEETPDGPAVRLDDGTLHTHVTGQVRRDILQRAGEAGPATSSTTDAT